MRTRLAATAALAALTLLVGCGSAATSSGGAAIVEPSLPACAPVTERARLPADLDGVIPLPPGTVVTSAKLTGQGPMVIAGYVPGGIREAATYLREELPKAGFTAGEGDAEQDEAEQSFSGHGLDGQWKVHSVVGCSEVVSLTLAVSGTPE